MKKNSMFFICVLIFALVFAVSCPNNKPSASITSPKGDDARISIEQGKDKTIDVVVELSNDTFNSESFNVSSGSETDLSTWFTSSDETKVAVSAKVKSLEEASSTKDDSEKIYVKATVSLTIKGVDLTLENTPVKVVFAIPTMSDSTKKWTVSNNRLEATNEIQITVEEPKEPSLSMTTPEDGTSWLVQNTWFTRNFVLELKNDTFNTEKVKEGSDVKEWFSETIDQSNIYEIVATVQAGSTATKAILSVQFQAGRSECTDKKIVIKIPEGENWTTSNVELTPKEILKVTLTNKVVAMPEKSVSYKVGDTGEREATFVLSNGTFKESFDPSTLEWEKNQQYSSGTVVVKSCTKIDNTSFKLVMNAPSAITISDGTSVSGAYDAYIPADQITADEGYALPEGTIHAEIQIAVSQN